MGELMEYTRGGPGEGDNRGATLVEKHNERMQQERENMALEKLAALMPSLGSKLRAFVLTKADWDVDAALSLLRSFQVAQLDKFNAITKKRKRIYEEIDEAAEAAPATKAPDSDNSSGGSSGKESSESGSESSSGSESDDDSGGKRESKKRKQDGSSNRKSSDKHKRSSKDKKRSKKDKKEKKKRRKDKDKEKEKKRKSKGEGDGTARPKAHSTDFGKFGVIREADADRKQSEFMAWALDVKKVDVEGLAKWEEKELFKEFVEDFNTGTLPHRKYYDLAAYEMSKLKEEQEKAAARMAAKQGTRKAAELNDEQELHRRRIEEQRKEKEKRLKEAMEALRKGGMADEMRRQEMLRAEMALAYKTGDKAKAQKIMDRLAPDDPTKKR